jgi:hypothetical protein
MLIIPALVRLKQEDIKVFCFVLVLGLEIRACTLSHSTSPFCDGYFQDRISQTICLGWLGTMILLISAS